ADGGTPARRPARADRERRRDPRRRPDRRAGRDRGRRLAPHRRPRRARCAGAAARHRSQGRHDRHGRRERRAGRGRGGPARASGGRRRRRLRAPRPAVGGGGRRDSRAARRQPRRGGGAARARRLPARPLQGAQAGRVRRAAAAHCLGQAAPPRAASGSGPPMTSPDEPDPDELRAAVRERWERSADGWRARNERFQAAAMPVSRWLVDAIEPQPGQTVLELAAGVGETGFLAAELIAPGGGRLISSDGAEAMLAHARERAEQLGVTNVEFKPLELEWIDLPAASVDAVVCRWGYMFALDRGAALRETRRVLRPGGRLALATWTGPQHNPFAAIPRRALVDAGLVDGFELGAGPGMFDLADPAALRELLEDGGFAEVVVERLELTIPYADVDDL